MTPAAILIAKVRSLGASLSSDGARLILDAPTGVITPDLREELVRLKPAILAELNGKAPNHFADAIPTRPIQQVAGLLAMAYRRYRAACRGGAVPSGDSRLANSRHQSVHGGDS